MALQFTSVQLFADDLRLIAKVSWLTFRQHLLAISDSVESVNSKHKRTLAAVFALPTSASVVFADIESLLQSLGAKVMEREGSRVKFELRGEQWRAHRPHPGKEARRYQVEEARELLERLGIRP